MARARIKRAMALGALAGAPEASEQLIVKGIDVLLKTRGHLQGAGLTAALDQDSGRRNYIYTTLSRKRKVLVHLDPRPPRDEKGNATGGALIVTIVRRTGRRDETRTASHAMNELAKMLGNNVEDTARVLLAIERARQRCYQLAEEATRWL